MLNKIALVFALATALAGALPAFVGMAFAQATITATARAEGLINPLSTTLIIPPLHGTCRFAPLSPRLHRTRVFPSSVAKGLAEVG